MLVLSRKAGDKIVIDGGIVVEVLQSRGNRVRLGITAPADVSVLRGEIADRLTPVIGSIGLDDSSALRAGTARHLATQTASVSRSA